MTEEQSNKYGDIIQHLIKSQRITLLNVEYAERIQRKLTTPQPLLHILKDLKLITDETVNEVVKETGLSIRIGKLLVELGHLSENDLEAAYNIQQDTENDLKIGEILEKYNFIDRKVFIKTLSIQLGYPIHEPSITCIDKKALTRVPVKMLAKHLFLPLVKDGETVVVFADPQQKELHQIVARFLGRDWKPAIADRELLKDTIQLVVNAASGQKIDVDSKTVIGLVNSILVSAIDSDVSDIHIEPQSDRLQVRFREDGVLRHFKDYSTDLTLPIVSRLKIMCKADIAEKRRHQGGRILFDFTGGQVDLRVSFYVTVHGEKVVLRILKQKQHLLDIHSIGILPNMLTRFLEDAVYQPSGVLLVTGPTGSGKTSTIYSCISHIKNPQISIITAEEPVEYIMDGIAQCSIDPQIDRTFQESLRHIVRQDPDVIVIGEIRDQDSAEMAMQSALTGHKVLSTFHTEDSIGGLIRLLNMDIAPFLISSTLVSVLAQRLLRKVCPFCSEDVTPTPLQLRRLGSSIEDLHGATFKKGLGCRNCNQSGYKGRIGVFELLVLNETVRNAILEHKTSHEIRDISIANSGLITLWEDGIVKAAAGATSIDEVLRTLPRLRKPRTLEELRRLSGV